MPNYRDVWVRIEDAGARPTYRRRFPCVREALAPEYRDLPDESVGGLIESLYPGSDPADIENFFSSLKKIGKTVADVGQKALPGVIQGATTGMALGPWGALAGGIAGGALSAATSGGRKTPAKGQAGRSAAPKIPGLGAIAGLAQSPAAAQLLRTVNSPVVGQALQALAMGGAGKQSVNVGGMNIPTAAITNALRQLLGQVETELHERTAGEAEGTPLYLLGSDGEFAVDPTDEAARAERVLEMISRAEAQSSEGRSAERHERFRVEADDEDDEWAEDDETDVEGEARTYYRGIYQSTYDY